MKVDAGGHPKYSAESELSIDDCVAVRLVLFTTSDRDKVVDFVRTRFSIQADFDPGEAKANGYTSRHFIVEKPSLDAPWMTGHNHAEWYFAEFERFEIQIGTVAIHAWAEYEHHVRYKPLESGYDALTGEQQDEIYALFSEAAHLRDEMDANFAAIEDILHTPILENAAPSRPDALPQTQTVDSQVLSALLATRYPTSRLAQHQKSYDWMLQILSSLGIVSLPKLQAVLESVDSEYVAALMAHKFAPSSVRLLDDDLLAYFGQNYLDANNTVPSSNLDDTRNDRERAKILQWRLRRINGKTRPYSLTGDGVATDVQGSNLSGADVFRRVLDTALKYLPVSEVLIGGGISLNDDLPPSARAVERVFGDTHLWVHANLTRSYAEELALTLIRKLPTTIDIQFRKSGIDLINRN